MKPWVSALAMGMLISALLLNYKLTFEVFGAFTWLATFSYFALSLIHYFISKVRADKEAINTMSNFKAFNKALHVVVNEERK